jgi:hypothetical protein
LQAPQWLGSVSALISQPLPVQLSQSIYGTRHSPAVQLPSTHIAFWWSKLQAVLQLPQWLTVSSGVSQPSAVMLLQSA